MKEDEKPTKFVGDNAEGEAILRYMKQRREEQDDEETENESTESPK